MPLRVTLTLPFEALCFHFDKNKKLGMVAPVWTDPADFPGADLIHANTVFCFRIPKKIDQKVVKDRLQKLNPELLIFLCKLRAITVTTLTIEGTSKSALDLSRTDSLTEEIKRTHLEHNTIHPKRSTKKETFLVFLHSATGMPKEPKRPSVKESDLLIAFPISDTFEPLLQNRMTYNFLPVRAYGLPFVLQGDFMLSASREDILMDNAWNEALVGATIDCFIGAVQSFNRQNVMKYAWPVYSESHGTQYGTILLDFSGDLAKRLRIAKVLESQSLTFEAPSKLETVPLVFSDGMSPPKPLLLPPAGAMSYVSTRYSERSLAVISVRQQDEAAFLRLLKKYTLDEWRVFRAQTAHWHSRLAKALLIIGQHKLPNAALIPLHDGRWLPANSETVYFPRISDGTSVPSGIKIAMIADEAAEDPSRARLFRALGARTIDSAQVFALIRDQHREHGQAYGNWELNHLIEHAWYLYSAPGKLRDTNLAKFLLAASTSPILHHGRDLHMALPGGFPVVSLFADAHADVRIHHLHNRYATRAPADQSEAWLAWLQKELPIGTLPRLSTATSSGMVASPELKWLVKHKPSNVWLLLLRDHWVIMMESSTATPSDLLGASL